MKSILSRIQGYYNAKKHAFRQYWSTNPADRGSSSLNLLRAFPLYRANMGGSYREKASISRASISNTIPFLSQLALRVGHAKLKTTSADNLPHDKQSKASALRLKAIFDRHGSDKSTLHNYHWLYGLILKDQQVVSNIFEIGLGSNDLSVACNMGPDGEPGASLRAWKEFCPKAMIYGADIDRRTLFQEDRIKTFYLDQTNPSDFNALNDCFPAFFDLIIDDGLHAVDANIQTLVFGLERIKVGGWIVIEDIPEAAEPLWQVVASLLPPAFESNFIRAQNGCLFAVQRRS